MKFLKFIIALIFLCANVLAASEVEILPIQNNYHTGENLQAFVLVNQQPLDGFNIGKASLYDQSGNKISSLLSLKIENGYFVYQEIPKLNNGNYSIGVKGLKYEEDGILKEKDFLADIQIKKSESFKITPFVYYDNEKEIVISAKNNGDAKKPVLLILPSFLSALRNPIEVPKDDEMRFFLNVKENAFPANITAIYEYPENNLSLNRSYIIPIIVRGFKEKENVTETNARIIEEKKLVFVGHSELNKTLEKTKTLEGELKIKNEGMEINFSVSIEGDIKEIVEANQTEFSLKNGEMATIYLVVNKNKNPEKNSYSGELFIQESNLSFPVLLTILKEEVQEEPIIPTDETGQVFEEEKPKINISEYFKEEKRKRKISTGMITFVILVLLAAFLIIFLKILKKPVKPKNKEIGEVIQKYK